MRSRLYHTPRLHPIAAPGARRVTWLELFCDLVLVAAMVQLAAVMAGEVTAAAMGKFVLHFSPLWLAWTGMTFHANRFDVDDFVHRFMVLLQLGAMSAMALSAGESAAGHHGLFAIAFSCSMGLAAAQNARAGIHIEEARAYTGYWGGVFALASVWFGTTALVSFPLAMGGWALGLGGLLLAPMVWWRLERAKHVPLDQGHLAERYGLFVLLSLGSAFIGLIDGLAGVSEVTETVWAAALAVASASAVWWVYFDDVAGLELRESRSAWLVWWIGHLPLSLGVVALGAALRTVGPALLHGDLHLGARWLLGASFAVILGSVAAVDAVTVRRQAELSDRGRVGFRAASCVLVALLAAVSAGLHAYAFLGMLAAVALAQVVFDISMAPIEAGALTEAVPVRELAGTAASPLRRDTLRDSVRIGAEGEIGRDLYYFFIQGSWWRVIVFFSFIYMAINLVFACLFMLQPLSFGGDTDRGFADAFFFSVHVLTSLGFGTIAPATTYGDVIVTIESAVGMLFAALATGAIFAKASRPVAGVVWSKLAVVSQRKGMPTLMIRLANARGSEIVDATITLTVLKDDISPEGHHMRRLHELDLVRSRSQVFGLSWLVMHRITEDSPLYGDDHGMLAIIATMMGHDGTYGQTTFARHVYLPEDVMTGRRYVDVISQLPDGRLVLDLTKFHDTEPDDVV